MGVLVLVTLAASLASLTLAGTSCSNPVPGVNKLVSGVDITELDMLPLDLTENNGFRNPILELTCDKGKKLTIQESDYQLPDQVWHTKTIPAGISFSEVKLYKSYDDIRRFKNIEVGLGGVLKYFSFSASGSYKTMQNTITNRSRYIADVQAFEYATHINMQPSEVLQIDRFAKNSLNRLTGNYSTNAKAYKDFIERFGTHFFSSGKFGGYIRVIHEIDKSYFYSKSDQEVKTNAKASFFGIISGQSEVAFGSTTVDEDFSKKSTKIVKYYGGNTYLLAEGGLQKWQSSVDKDPWLFSGELEPISRLIKDERIKSSIEQAMTQYILQKYLKELQRIVNFFKNKGTPSYVSNLENKITAMQGLTTLVESDVEALGSEVDRELTVPDWFSAYTQLCFKWQPDEPNGQCGEGKDELLCANPNTMTTYYRDNTDDRSGGCRMQWGIKSTGFEDWFAKVQVCFRWYADGNSEQCGGGVPREICAPVHSFTSEYRDNTDGRSGGCEMSWRLVLPSDAPIWMKGAKLCYTWSPDSNNGQCGGGAARDLCALAGQWTEYYRDATDQRAGGCRMRWGITLSSTFAGFFESDSNIAQTTDEENNFTSGQITFGCQPIVLCMLLCLLTNLIL